MKLAIHLVLSINRSFATHYLLSTNLEYFSFTLEDLAIATISKFIFAIMLSNS